MHLIYNCIQAIVMPIQAMRRHYLIYQMNLCDLQSYFVFESK